MNTEYIDATGPIICVRCTWFSCETSRELIAHLDKCHPGWTLETSKDNTILPENKMRPLAN
jgi:hypothetical protein